jgi:hypothetical protein
MATFASLLKSGLPGGEVASVHAVPNSPSELFVLYFNWNLFKYDPKNDQVQKVEIDDDAISKLLTDDLDISDSTPISIHTLPGGQVFLGMTIKPSGSKTKHAVIEGKWDGSQLKIKRIHWSISRVFVNGDSALGFDEKRHVWNLTDTEPKGRTFSRDDEEEGYGVAVKPNGTFLYIKDDSRTVQTLKERIKESNGKRAYDVIAKTKLPREMHGNTQINCDENGDIAVLAGGDSDDLETTCIFWINQKGHVKTRLRVFDVLEDCTFVCLPGKRLVIISQGIIIIASRPEDEKEKAKEPDSSEDDAEGVSSDDEEEDYDEEEEDKKKKKRKHKHGKREADDIDVSFGFDEEDEPAPKKKAKKSSNISSDEEEPKKKKSRLTKKTTVDSD